MLTDQDKRWLVDNCGKVERFFLYLLMFLTFVHSCSIDTAVKDIQLSIEHIEKKIR